MLTGILLLAAMLTGSVLIIGGIVLKFAQADAKLHAILADIDNIVAEGSLKKSQ